MSGPPASKVLWDDFGLTSGIKRQVDSLKPHMASLGVELSFLGNSAWTRTKTARVLWLTWLSRRQSSPFQSVKIFHGFANFNAPLSSRAKPFKVVLTIHDLIPLLYPDLVSRTAYLQSRLLFKQALKSADSLVCVSQWTADCLLNYDSKVHDRVRVIKNGCDLQPKRAIEFIYQRQNSKQGTLKVLTVSRVEAYKRLELIPEILDRLPANVEWQIVSDKKGYEKLKNLSLSRSMQGRLRIFHSLTQLNLDEIYRNSHVYVHPSLAEGYGLPLSEALSFGLPLIYVSGTGCAEADVTQLGFALSSKEGPEAWAAAIVASQEDSHRAKLLNLYANIKTEEFAWSQRAKELKALYDYLLI